MIDDLPVVRVWVHFTEHHAMNVVVEGPDGPFDAGLTRCTSDLGRIAREAAHTAWRTDTFPIEITVDRPFWIKKGTLVELTEDPEGATHPYAYVTGFLPMGRVLVRHPQTGDGVYATEEFTAVR
ncbi:hypothetical protein [Actinoplanes sp. NPDC051494]|uniref:hypothetical protein n=1 Tax=Actinoplanes sp. NPDC051494 TaxID=3363907 RepID=UPI00378CF3C0